MPRSLPLPRTGNPPAEPGGRRRAAWALALAGALVGSGASARAEKLLGDPISVRRHAEASAGPLLAGGGIVMTAAVGETAVQAASGGSLRMERGLMSVAAQPGSVVAITAVSKSTGTLDLAWTAPGLDGFLGDVVSGFYRVDYSSDAAHPFAPTSYRLEFATAVVPGAAQSLRLEGLSPNTTYYTRIYLADARKYFAEDSRPSAESTLANIPIDPVVVAVSSTQVTLSWLVPSGGAAGYSADASSTSFGALGPGGALLSSSTADGEVASLTVAGLTPNTTYFFRVASLNWQQDRNYTLIFPVLTTLSGTPLPVFGLIGSQNALARSVALNWTRASYRDPTGVLVILSTHPAVGEVVGGRAFSPGEVLADGSIVKSTATADSIVDRGLTLDTTYFYHIFSEGRGPLYSVAVTTAVFLDLPPFAPTGLTSELSPDRSRVTLAWSPTRSNLDGSAFASTVAARAVELSHYEIDRSTALSESSFVRIATAPIDTLTFTDAVPNPNLTYVYRVRAVDSLGTWDRSMAVSSDGDLFVFSDQDVSHLRVPRALVRELAGADVLLKAKEEPADGAEGIFRTVRFEGLRAPAATPVERFAFSRPEVSVSLRYEVAGGVVVPRGAAPRGAYPQIPSSQAGENLSLYWHDGGKFVKMFGSVDSSQQTVSLRTSITGTYQIRSLLRDQAFNFDPSTLSNKVITPNGDGLNDTAVFRFENPRDSSFSGRIFDVTGAAVADMGPGPVRNSLQWDGRASGRAVSGGIYVYQIRGEGKTFTGTVMVIQ